MKIQNKDKLLLSIKNKNGMMKIMSAGQETSSKEYLEFGRNWFTLPNFVKDRDVVFKISTLKSKNDDGEHMLCMDFIVMKKEGQKPIDEKLYKKVLKKVSEIGIKFANDISRQEKRNRSIVIRQAAKWMVEE